MPPATLMALEVLAFLVIVLVGLWAYNKAGRKDEERKEKRQVEAEGGIHKTVTLACRQEKCPEKDKAVNFKDFTSKDMFEKLPCPECGKTREIVSKSEK